MRLPGRLAIAAFALVPGALAAQVQMPPNPTVPSIPDVTFDLGPNTREYVAAGCAQIGAIVVPGSTPVTVRLGIPHCTAARLVYSWTGERGVATMFLAHSVHPWIERLGGARSENNMSLTVDLAFVGRGQLSRVDQTFYWQGFGDDGRSNVLTAFIAGDFSPARLDQTRTVPVSTTLYYHYGRDNAGGLLSSTLSLRFTAVPEPSTYALLGTGLLTLAGIAARRRTRAET